MMKIFLSDLRRNITKILCLTIGMAIGLILIAKIYYEQTYDSFYPDADRIYRLYEVFNDPDRGPYDFERTSGAYAPAMKRYLPQVEAATRFTFFGGENKIKLDDNRKFEVNSILLADSCFFDVFSTKIISGDPHQVLNVKNSCMIPKSLADKIGGDVIGLQFSMPDRNDDYKGTIGGVYEDFPDNSSIKNNIYISIDTMDILGYGDNDNWVGNELYTSFVKLHKDVVPENLKLGIRKMLEDNIDKDILNSRNFDISLRAIVGGHAADSSVKEMVTMLIVLAVLILLCASINYLLIVIGQISGRSKSVAIRKCFGTGNTKIFMMIMGESLCYIVISFLLAIVIVFALGDICNELLGISPQLLFSTKYVWLVECLIMIAILMITGVIPGVIYCKTSVIRSLKGNVRKKKIWKLALLSIQFLISGFLFCLLILIGRQYRLVTNFDMGYDYDNVADILMKNGMQESIKLKNEILRLSCVESVAGSTHSLLFRGGGEIIFDNDDNNVVQISDMMQVGRDIFDLLGFKFIQGETFKLHADSTLNEVVVEERMVDVLRTQFGLEDTNIIGKTFKYPYFDGSIKEYTICGVVNNFHRGGFEEDKIDKQPAVFFPGEDRAWSLNIKFNKMSHENLQKVQRVIDKVISNPNWEINITPYKNKLEIYTYQIKKFATAVMVVGIAILLIALSGLLGYVSDEVENRSKEIAIRKVSGTSEYKILKLFCRDIAIIAVPSLIVGGIIAMIVGRDWLSRFCNQVSLSPIISVVCVIILLLLILSMVVFNSLKIARSNPVEYLRNE